MLASLAPLARFAPAVLGKVAEALIPGAGAAVRQVHEWYLDKRESAEKGEILKALQITQEKLNAFDRMFIILGKECGELLDRVAALEANGQDSADEIAREVLRHPELQQRFADFGLQVGIRGHGSPTAEVRTHDAALAAVTGVRIPIPTGSRPADPLTYTPLAAVTGAYIPTGSPSATPLASPTAGRVPQVGDTLDGWVLETKLGGGGWGIVFRATKKGQTKALLKVMRPDLSTQGEFVDAFTDEVFKLLRLKHANIVAVERNGFCTAFMCHYFVMPLLDGLNLEQHLAQHGVPSAEVTMGWLTGLLDGLEHAHAAGLIHRDVKPQNVMIVAGTAVLIDFGIAGLEGVAGHTQALGKSSFFAPPEMHSLGEADARADLFMLAATTFYALRFDQPLKERAWSKFKPDRVPEPFRAALAAALNADDERRPKSPSDMKGLLESNVVELELVTSDLRQEYREFAQVRLRTAGWSKDWLLGNAARVPEWEKAARGGDGMATVLYADACRFGIGVPVDMSAAARWLRQAAHGGNAVAMYALGQAHQYGWGVPKVLDQALSWYRRSADASCAEGLYGLACLHRNGEGVEKDLVVALRYFQAAGSEGHVLAMYAAGDLLQKSKNTEEHKLALMWYLQGASTGDGNCLYQVGECFRRGIGTARDPLQAQDWFRKGAEQGSYNAMFALGQMSALGDGVPKSPETAIEWYLKAERAGHPSVAYFVASARSALK